MPAVLLKFEDIAPRHVALLRETARRAHKLYYPDRWASRDAEDIAAWKLLMDRGLIEKKEGTIATGETPWQPVEYLDAADAGHKLLEAYRPR
jgi:hypothetical protein